MVFTGIGDAFFFFLSSGLESLVVTPMYLGVK